MAFGIFRTNGKNAAKLILTVKMKLYDESEVTVHVEDTQLLFKTALGDSKIALRNVARMENVGHVVTLRKLLEANKFEIYCTDGCKIVGVPKSPAKIHLNGLNAPHERGDIKLWEIDSLEVLSSSNDEH
jgi:hypothetical protein